MCKKNIFRLSFLIISILFFKGIQSNADNLTNVQLRAESVFAQVTILLPFKNLKVKVHGVSGVRRVVSCVHGSISFKSIKNGISVSLPLNTVNVLKLYK